MFMHENAQPSIKYSYTYRMYCTYVARNLGSDKTLAEGGKISLLRASNAFYKSILYKIHSTRGCNFIKKLSTRTYYIKYILQEAVTLEKLLALNDAALLK